MTLIDAFVSAVLPVLTIAAAGFALGTVRDLNVDALAAVAIYILLPALVFHSVATTEIPGATAVTLGLGVGLFVLGMAVLSSAVGRALGETDPVLGSLVLSSTFSNAGNYGIPLAAFAFGAVGRSTAVLYIVFQTVLMYTVGVYLASRGSSESVREAALEVFKLPLVYAVVVACLARLLDAVPADGTASMEAIRLTGDAAIPVMLVLLGIQLASTSYGSAIRRSTPVFALKLFASPILAVVIALGIGLDGDVGRVYVLACAMPTAVTPLMLVVEYGSGRHHVSAPEYVSTAILLTTVASAFTLTVLIAILQAGVVL